MRAFWRWLSRRFLAIALPISAAQEKQSGEIVANLATGRVDLLRHP